MIVLGIVLLLIGYFTGISILYTIGGILVVVGVFELLDGHDGVGGDVTGAEDDAVAPKRRRAKR